MALFLFPLAKALLAFLPTTYFVALRSPFPLWQAQFVEVFPLELASFCKLSADLGIASKSVISFPFCSSLTSPSCPFLRFSFYLNLPGRNCLFSPPLLSGFNGSLDPRFSRGTPRLMSWPDRERYMCSLQSLLVSLLLPLVSTLIFSRTVLSKFFGTQVPSIFPEGLMLLLPARCVLFCSAATDTAFCQALNCLELV